MRKIKRTQLHEAGPSLKPANPKTSMRKIRKPVARPTDPETSWEAARSLTDEQLRESQERVLKEFERIGPMTDEGLISALKVVGVSMSDSGARTRRKELVDKGLIRDSGKRAETPSGRKTIIWELADDDE